ncbi:histidine kinase [Paenibacillus sp. FSL R10-2734]|uniref:cache domain-containing sensor histidine kinase n=1 Tax=Paenibacillus sp. FSL R10-2734 TaxID=2954691 RepID=UPI0030DB13A4
MSLIKSINFKISLFFILVITIMIVASNGTIYMMFSKIMVNRMIEDQANIMLQNKKNIENLTNGINQATAYFFSNKAIADILNRDSDDALQVLIDQSVLQDQLDNFSTVPILSSLDSYHTTLFLFDGYQISKELNSLAINERTFDKNRVSNSVSVSNESWYRATEEADGALYTFTLPQDNNHIYIARLLRNKYIRVPNYIDNMGVIVVGIDRNYFSSHIEASRLTESTQIYLVNDSQQVIYSNNTEAVGQQISSYNIPQAKLERSNEESFTLRDTRGDVITTVYTLQWGWKLVTMIPKNDITASLAVIRNIIIITTLLCIITGGGLTILISKRISQPITRLAMTMRHIRSTSNIDVSIKSPQQDEIGYLYNSFNSMMKRIHHLMDDVYESTNKQKDEELKRLQAQINPHFIYNTLDAINWMVLSKNDEKVITMVSSLADILRYSIKHPDDKVQLSEEIAHVKTYAQIQLIRYSHFAVTYEIDPSILDMQVPKFIIQPLVENAIMHGISKLKKDGKIEIIGRRFEETIQMMVVDNGPGADAELLNNYLRGSVQVLRDSDGFGIQNVNERVKINYGNRYGLSYRNNEDGQLFAIIILPYESNSNGS